MKISEDVKASIEKADIIYVSTSGKEGIPHLAAGEKIVIPQSGHIRLEAWFCVKTVENLTINPHIAIATVDPITKEGYQLIGKVEKIDDKRMMDGFVPDLEEKWAGLSTTEYTLYVEVSEVLKFNTGVHSDLPLSDL